MLAKGKATNLFCRCKSRSLAYRKNLVKCFIDLRHINFVVLLPGCASLIDHEVVLLLKWKAINTWPARSSWPTNSHRSSKKIENVYTIGKWFGFEIKSATNRIVTIRKLERKSQPQQRRASLLNRHLDTNITRAVSDKILEGCCLVLSISVHV